MKKWLSLFLAFLLTVGMTACGQSQGGEISSTTVIQTSPEVSAPVESQTPEEQELLAQFRERMLDNLRGVPGQKEEG